MRRGVIEPGDGLLLGAAQGPEDMSRAPHGRPQALDGSIVEAVLGLRRRFPWFGPKKLVGVERPEIAWPSASTRLAEAQVW
jgi:hypothetical protein